MDMLTKRDLGQIGKLIRESEVRLEKKIGESSDKVISAVGEMLEQNVLPQFDGVYARLDGVEARLTKVEATMVTKDYLDEKLGALRGDTTLEHKALDRRLTALETRPVA
jgi:hypothetical protein